MNSMDEFFDYVQQIDPLWSAVLVALALGVLLVATLWSASFLRVIAGVVALAVVGAITAGGYYGYLHFDELRRIDERRALDERAEALFNKTIEPDSVFACIDGSPAPAMHDACERSLFAEPSRVAAAVAIVTQRLAFLGDALAFVAARDGGYGNRIESMRNAIEADPYGFVAFVLSVEHRCTHDSCGRLSLLRDPARVKENMRVRRLEAHLAKYSANWRGSSDLPDEPATGGRTASPLVTISEPSPPKADPQADAGSKEVAEPAERSAAAGAPSSPATETVDLPAAALAPVITPSSDAGFGAPPASAAPIAVTPAPAKGAGAAAAKASPASDKGTPRPAAQAKAKAKAIDPAVRRSSEPVAGLPRVVPSEYIREQEEKKEAASAQSTAQPPGAPTPISPLQQNFIGR